MQYYLCCSLFGGFACLLDLNELESMYAMATEVWVNATNHRAETQPTIAPPGLLPQVYSS